MCIFIKLFEAKVEINIQVSRWKKPSQFFRGQGNFNNEGARGPRPQCQMYERLGHTALVLYLLLDPQYQVDLRYGNNSTNRTSLAKASY